MTRQIVVLLIATALLVLAFFAGHKVGVANERRIAAELESATLREQAREITRQMNAVAKKQKEYNYAQKQISNLATRLRGSDRLRVQAEHAAAIERATTESIRAYATGINGLYETCRREYIEMGLEAARAAAGLEALNK
jgi:hypothetical protein